MRKRGRGAVSVLVLLYTLLRWPVPTCKAESFRPRQICLRLRGFLLAVRLDASSLDAFSASKHLGISTSLPIGTIAEVSKGLKTSNIPSLPARLSGCMPCRPTSLRAPGRGDASAKDPRFIAPYRVYLQGKISGISGTQILPRSSLQFACASREGALAIPLYTQKYVKIRQNGRAYYFKDIKLCLLIAKTNTRFQLDALRWCISHFIKSQD